MAGIVCWGALAPGACTDLNPGTGALVRGAWTDDCEVGGATDACAANVCSLCCAVMVCWVITEDGSLHDGDTALPGETSGARLCCRGVVCDCVSVFSLHDDDMTLLGDWCRGGWYWPRWPWAGDLNGDWDCWGVHWGRACRIGGSEAWRGPRGAVFRMLYSENEMEDLPVWPAKCGWGSDIIPEMFGWSVGCCPAKMSAIYDINIQHIKYMMISGNLSYCS